MGSRKKNAAACAGGYAAAWSCTGEEIQKGEQTPEISSGGKATLRFVFTAVFYALEAYFEALKNDSRTEQLDDLPGIMITNRLYKPTVFFATNEDAVCTVLYVLFIMFNNVHCFYTRHRKCVEAATGKTTDIHTCTPHTHCS